MISRAFLHIKTWIFKRPLSYLNTSKLDADLGSDCAAPVCHACVFNNEHHETYSQAMCTYIKHIPEATTNDHKNICHWAMGPSGVSMSCCSPGLWQDNYKDLLAQKSFRNLALRFHFYCCDMFGSLLSCQHGGPGVQQQRSTLTEDHQHDHRITSGVDC